MLFSKQHNMGYLNPTTLDALILVPLCTIIETIICITWFWKLYTHSQAAIMEQKIATISHTTIASNSTLDVSKPTHTHSASSSKQISDDIRKPEDKSISHSLSELVSIQKWLASASFIFGFIFCWLSLILMLASSIQSNSHTECIHLWQYASMLLFAILMRFMLYTYYMTRTYFIFQATLHEIAYTRMKCYVGTMSILYCICIAMFVYTAVTCQHTLFLLVGALTWVSETILAVICVKLSVNRLFTLYHMNKPKENDTELGKQKHKKRNDHWEILMRVSTKISVLTLVAIISTNVIVCCFAIISRFQYSLTVVDNVINTLCLLLSFAAFENHYQMLCKGCDQCTLKCCTQHTGCVRCCCCIYDRCNLG
eukprot:1078720_1